MKHPFALILAAGTTGLAALAIALPGVAAAYPTPGGGSAPGIPTDPYACGGDAVRRAQAGADPQVLSYLSVHPDLEAELERLNKLPEGQRDADWQSYSRSHPQEAADYRDALAPIHDFHQLCDNNHQLNRPSDMGVPGY
ncbi:hemophore-related protein [Nocardia jiangxiensis]|uniref:Hemophore-related protein n=1 Tax=Nocardia jiangxiensis TaxID=282685 RepID=A0ABW6SCD6_9NOCA|nr:hemophore-related protein [Nocardia jiangxiensis]